jgi:hypothetical protein
VFELVCRSRRGGQCGTAARRSESHCLRLAPRPLMVLSPMSGRGLKRLMALPCRASETPRLAAGP